MSVRCEQCKTEYEFDEAQISEAGVAVTCTNCGHVFLVKKGSVLVSGPVQRESAPVAGLPDASAVFEFSPPKPKEWKVRQANKDILTFKELATLQRWIIEGKVSRQDEISLSGESWKRLGNIAELASFFKIVDDAKRSAEQSQPPPPPPESSFRTPLPRTERTPAEWYSGPRGERTPPIHPTPLSEFENFSFDKMPPAADAPPAISALQTEAAGRVGAARVPGDPAFAQGDRVRKSWRDSDLEAAAALRKRPTKPTMAALVLLAVVLVGYLAYYFWVFLPERQNRARVEAAVAADVAQKAEQQRVAREHAEAERAEATAALRDLEANPAGESGRTESTKVGARAGSERAEPPKVAARPESEQTEPTKVGARADGERNEPPKVAARADTEQTEPTKVRARRDSEGASSEARANADTIAGDGKGGSEATDSGSSNRPKAARRTFESVLSEGDRLRERERPMAALRAYAKAAELDPNRAEPLTGRGLALIDLGRVAEAEKSLQQALRLNHNSSIALMGLAEAYRAQGKKSEAIRYYQRYLEVLPNGPEASVARSAIKALQE